MPGERFGFIDATMKQYTHTKFNATAETKGRINNLHVCWFYAGFVCFLHACPIKTTLVDNTNS